jgi:hypothetical protein
MLILLCLEKYAMGNTIIYATCDNDTDTACFPKYITLPLKWLTRGSKYIAKLQTSYFDVRTVHLVQFIIQTHKCTTYIYIYI